MYIRNLSAQFLDLLFPRHCIHCQGSVQSKNNPLKYLCKDCERELFYCDPPACKTCGYPFFGSLMGSKTCPHCVELEPVFEAGKTLFLGKGAGRSFLHELKYHSGFYVLKDIATIIRATPHFSRFLENAFLVPVPLHPAKKRQRGFNQSELLANVFAKSSQALGVLPILKRTRFTNSQTLLNGKERAQNVKNAFALSKETDLISNLNYILVDDVFTTGSTLNACARVLRAAGAQHLKVITLSHG